MYIYTPHTMSIYTVGRIQKKFSNSLNHGELIAVKVSKAYFSEINYQVNQEFITFIMNSRYNYQ